MFLEFLNNVVHNLFKPLLLFFYAGFLIPVLGVKFEFPKVIYQGLVIYLLLAIGWHGGEELAGLEPAMYAQAAGFMFVGFFTNLLIGITAYFILRLFTKLRKIDAATVAGYYGSDSAGTFVTCIGMLTAAHIAFAPYMPVLLAVMEIPGCLVALFLVANMRAQKMDVNGNMPDEAGYQGVRALARKPKKEAQFEESLDADEDLELATVGASEEGYADEHANAHTRRATGGSGHNAEKRPEWSSQPPGGGHHERDEQEEADDEAAAKLALQPTDIESDEEPAKRGSMFNKELLHEVLLNPGIYLLFAGIGIGFISRLQGESVVKNYDTLFGGLFQGVLCLFLLEMGITAAQKLKDIRVAGWQYVAFGILAPNLFATMGMLVAHGYSLFLGQPFDLGTYVVFAVLCGAASYIALPAVQRLAIPEASPTLPLAASLGLTFTYNVTIGIPVYVMLATLLTTNFPIPVK